MATSGYAARVGAAAFALGLTLGAPLVGTAPVAAADASDSAVSGAADTSGAAKPARTARGPRAAYRGNSDPGTSARPAAAADIPADTESAINPRRGPRIRATTDTEPPAAVAASDSPVATPAAPERTERPERPERPVAQPPALRSIPVPAAAPSVPVFADAAVTHAAIAAPPAPAVVAPTALATVSTPVGAATSSFAGILDGLFGPIRAFFEGAALMVRRTLFNEAPAVSPVQLTGLSDGPITGTIGAVDPEGDPLAYAVTGDPRYGTVTVSQDGSYTYNPGESFAGIDSFIVAVTDTGRHINLRDLKRPTSTDVSVAVAQGALAPSLRFQFVYGSGSQFWSPAARSALESAATQLAGYFVVTSPVTVTYAVTGESSPLSSTLASAGSDFIDPGTGFMQTVVQKKIQTGLDGNGAAADGEISWNFGPSWGFGNTVSTGQYDFQATAMHELVHTLGFLSYADRAGSNTGQTWTVYDSYLVNSAGVAAIGSDYIWNTAYNANLTGGNGGLYFGGPSAVTAYGGLVPLYTPFPYASGSSLSHLDDDAFRGANEQLMTAVSGQGQGVRVLSPVELGILADIGYQLAPGSGSTLMLLGFFVGRRLRKKV